MMLIQTRELGAPGGLPARPGRYGPFGGQFVPEVLVSALKELEAAYQDASSDPQFAAELGRLEKLYVGRPTPLYPAERLSQEQGGATILLKREDLAHTGAHKINNAVGQALLARRMGKRRIIAETGAGQHGVAAATVCARFGMDCIVYMGEDDIQRQKLNVLRMRLLGARVIAVTSGSRTLKDAVNEAMRDWVANVTDSYYMIGSAVGPHPYPLLVREFQAVIGREARIQCLDQCGRLPSQVVACVGGGSNAIGIFHGFLSDQEVALVGVEAGGRGDGLGEHAATISYGSPGVLHGAKSFVLQDENGQVASTHSISAGLDYPGVGPEHSFLHATGRVKYTVASDEQALAAFELLSRTEGIIPAMESAHALAIGCELAQAEGRDGLVIVNLSGRGDKDLDIYEGATGGHVGQNQATTPSNRRYRTVGAP